MSPELVMVIISSILRLYVCIYTAYLLATFLSVFTGETRNFIQTYGQPVKQSFVSAYQRLLYSRLAYLLFIPFNVFVYVTVARKYSCPKSPPAKALQAIKRKAQVPADSSSSDEERTPPTGKCQLLSV